VKVGLTSGGISTGVMVGVKASWVAMDGAVVEVGKMYGLSETTNGSKGGGFISRGSICKEEGVGVSGIPQIEVEGELQAVMEIPIMRMMVAMVRCISF
jgi:hypothetical protein